MSSLDDTSPPPPSRLQRWAVPSLRLRITLLCVAVFVVVQLVLSVALYAHLRRARGAELEFALRERARSLATTIASSAALPSNESFAVLVDDEPRSLVIEQLLASLYTERGRVLASNCNPELGLASSGVDEAAPGGGGEAVRRQTEIRALATPGGRARPGVTVARRLADPTGRGLVLVVASSDAGVAALADRLRDAILLAAAVGAAAAFASGWLIAGIAVRPLRRLQQIAQLLSPSSLGARIDFGSTATEVRRLQERLNEARQRLDAGYRAQEQFAGNVAHELKTPLAIIVAQADLIRASRALTPEAKRFIDVTRDEALRLARLCESFLLLTRVRHGKPIHTTARPYLVNEWVMDCVQDSQGVAGRFGIELAPTLLDEEAMDARVAGDRELLCTMLDNLIRNACRFSQPGQAVEVGADLVGEGRVRVTVRDHGPGVPPNMLERIFERFEQADNAGPADPASTGGRRGSGIGLQIAQGIARLHDGTIGVENRAGGGCAFTATLPLMAEPHAEAEAAEVRPDAGAIA